MRIRQCCLNGLPVANCCWLFPLLLIALPAALRAGEPAQPAAFKHAGIIEAWNAYKHKLTFGKGQTLALVDDVVWLVVGRG